MKLLGASGHLPSQWMIFNLFEAWQSVLGIRSRLSASQHMFGHPALHHVLNVLTFGPSARWDMCNKAGSLGTTET